MVSEDIEIHTNCPLEGVAESEETVTLTTSQGAFDVDCVVIAVGVRSDSKLAADCGLKLGSKGGIVVDDRMTTSDPKIYAAGDCIEVTHLITGKPMQLPLGSLANRQGRVVGSNLGGGDEIFGPVVGSAAVKIYDMNIASTGLTEAAAREAGFDVGCAWGTFTDKADYFPETQAVHFKLVFDRGTQRLLGLQGYGKGEVVKRVDVFAALLKNEGKLESLLDMEFADAPPYAPAVDPLFSMGCAARNALFEEVEAFSPDTQLDNRVIVDVRQPNELEADPLGESTALNIPFVELRERWKEIPEDASVAIVCEKGIRSSECVRILKEKGLSDVAYLGGGIHMKISR
jgi:rhodanese-related sulfurtransferase